MTRVLTEKETKLFSELLGKAEECGKAYLLPKSSDQPVVIIDFTNEFKSTLKEAFIKSGLEVNWGLE